MKSDNKNQRERERERERENSPERIPRRIFRTFEKSPVLLNQKKVPLGTDILLFFGGVEKKNVTHKIII